MKNQFIAVFIFISYFCIQLVNSCTSVYFGDARCDPRCRSQNCDVFYSQNNCCDGCQPYVVNYYQEQVLDMTTWTSYYSSRCSSTCPPYQYPVNSNYTCAICDRNCTTCTGPSNTQCLTCAPTSYQKSSTECYNMGLKSYGYDPCPDGYYGIQLTMRCQPCPTGCSTCNIYLENLMPGANYPTTKSMDNTSCALDPLCSYTLKCYSCNNSLGYFLEEGFCFKNVCHKYQIYNSTAVSFDSSLCSCMDGYYPAGVTCSRCSFSCQTCTSSASNACTSCPSGSTLTSGSCIRSSSTTLKEDWTSNGILSGASGSFTMNQTFPSNTSICGSFTWLFGFSTYTVSTMTLVIQPVKLTYASTSFSNGGHYGIHFRATFLFVDQWTSTMSIYFRQSNRDIYAYNYLMQNVLGEYLCGLNYHDHITVIDFWFPHTTTSVNLVISASTSTYSWGIKDIIMQELKCDPSCITCNGSSAFNCTSCPTNTNQVLLNGDCVCDIANGWYLNAGACTQTCPPGTWKDNTTLSCASSCNFPLMFYYNGMCYEKCPAAAPYRRWTDYNCVADCFDPSITDNTLNLYKFDGVDKSCYNTCPNSTYGDPQSKSCVSQCPSTSSKPDYATYGLFVDGNFCTQVCSSSKYAFTGTRKCVSSCPAGFYINSKDYGHGNGVQLLCQNICSVTLGGLYLYGNNKTSPYQCVDLCPNQTYADIATHMCLGNCNQTAYKQTVVIGANTVRSCQLYCQSTSYDIFGNNITHICVTASNCPNNTYGDYQSTFCQLICTDPLHFGNNATRLCSTTCTTGFKQRNNKTCVKTCPAKNLNNNPQFGDPVSGYCQQTCTGGPTYFADNQTNRQCVQTCAATPMQTYGLNGKCVFNCSSSTWADPFHVNRLCTTSCTYSISGTKSYGFNSTRVCLSVCPDTQFGQLIASIPLCVFICVNNQYGNPVNNLCVDNCPAPYYGDPTGNRTCVLQCLQNGYFALNLSAQGVDTLINRTCVQSCPYGWADNTTRICAMTPFDCSQGLYAHETNHKCVTAMQCTGFADPVSRKCVPVCYVNDSQNIRYFGDLDTHMCVIVCPNLPDYYGDNSTNQCQLSCQQVNQIRDPQNNRRCVTNTNCSRLPIPLFGDLTAATCVIARNCTLGTYGDNNTKKCQIDCQGPNLLYADPISKQCVDVCQPRYYSFNSSVNVGICSLTCPLPLWADNITKRCESQCSPLTYGVNWTDPLTPTYHFGICQTQCPINQFARDTDNLCVSNCGPDHWGETTSRKCLIDPFQCPDGYYADNATNMCVQSVDCSIVNGVQYVADNLTKQCLSGCPPQSTIINWADLTKNLCVAKCPFNKFGDNNTLTCIDECKTGGVYNGEYADPQLRICVVVCSAYPIPTYGENDTYTCVQARYCPANQWADYQYYDRVCVNYCPDPRVNSTFLNMFADNVSKTCVFECPTRYYANVVYQSNYGMCVSICPPFANLTLKFADDSTKNCVEVCPQSQNTFGDPTTLRCVTVCPIGWYAQKVHSILPNRYCVQTCDTDTWSENIKRTCVQDPFDCPTINGYHWYAHNSSTSCVSICPATEDLWGQNTTYTCQPVCKIGSFKYNITRVCIDLCPGSLEDDGSFSDQGRCYVECITPGYYRDPQNSRSCQPICSFSPMKYYADDTTMRCVLDCPSYPQYYYAYDPDRACRIDCPSSLMRDTSTLRCVSSCPNATFFDTNSDQCVSQCPSDYSTGQIWYGDPTQMIPKCVLSTDCPSNYFADDNVQLCVQSCSEGQFKYGKNCVTFCPDGYFGNKQSGFCVIPSDCPTNLYAQLSSRLCIEICNGSFADTNAKTCVDVCPDGYFSDPATRLCSLSCTNNNTISLHENADNKTCISNCPEGLFLNTLNNICQPSCSDPYYQDPTTQICISVCPSSPPLYGQNDTNQCVQQCNNQTNQFKWQQGRLCVTTCPNGLLKNNFTRFCVKQCYNNTFAASQYCVYNCTPQYALLDPNICVSSCPSPYFKDSTSFQCVLQCSTFPLQYYKVVTSTDRRCDLNCPLGQFREDLTYSCVSLCPLSPPTFADISSGNCTSVCSLGYFAYKQSRTCLSKCPGSLFADPMSRTCVQQCENGTDMFGDRTLAIPQCVKVCSPGTFANYYTLTCDPVCETNPKTYGFDNSTYRICLQSCPYPYVANNFTQLCEINCLSSQYPYLDKAAKQCVSQCTSPMYQYGYLPTGQTVNGSCVTFCPSNYFAYIPNNTCVVKCPDGYYGDVQNQTCYQNCSEANSRFADNVINMCVDTCKKYNQSYDSFADMYSRQCVVSCPQDKFTIKDNNTRKCEARCTLLTQYADWTTGYCVSTCPIGWYADPNTLTCINNCSLYSQRYIYETNRSCVSNCKDVNLFADDSTRTCVTSLQCPDGYWGLIATGVCVDQCPTSPSMFGDVVTKTCVLTCPNQTTGFQNYYADPSTRECVKICPPVPSLFARNDTRSCVSECPFGSFADNYTRRCVQKCSIIPGQTFADNSTNRCVSACPTQPNYFASNQTYQCVLLCPSNPKMYADYSTRACVQNCPGGDNDTYAEQTTRFCVKICPGSTFMQNTTRTCQSICKTGFADPQTKFCIAICPQYTYGHVSSTGIKTCMSSCPTQSPAIYAQNSNNLCMTQCLAIYNTYRDPTTNRCVKICPINQSMFADNVSRICCTQCPANYYSDYSTRYCVSQCPQTPALFAILDVRVCSDACPANSWADNKTRTCVLGKCPSTPDTYADNSTWKCVSECPTKPMTWADNSSRNCVPQCPSNPDYYADNYTRKCVYKCSQQTFADSTTRNCVETCPNGWYGVNSTRRCEQVCPSGQFADILLHLCVQKCSVDPIFYGNPDNNICVSQCPAVNNSFGNPLTQECVNYQLDGFSGCPATYFAQNYTRLCVPVCPFKINNTRIDTYGDNSTWKCVVVCPAGTQNTFSDNSTMRCVKTCPTYPEYYAQQYSRRCVALCLQSNATFSGTFSDNSTRKCVQNCPSSPDYFSDNSTRRCVFYCSKSPLTFADYSTRRCVNICPSSPDIYGDLSTGRCVDMCPQSQQTYADYSTRLCVKVCPTNPSLYGENVTNVCVSACPNGTFADNSSRLCIAVCPEYPDTYGDPSTQKCVAMCPTIPDLYADRISQQCVSRCPSGYYAQNVTRRCLPNCPQDKINYADNKTNRCVQTCPDFPTQFATYGDNRTQNCIIQCPSEPFTYADNITRICLTICNNVTNGGFADNSSRVCVQKCPDLTYGDITTRYCVRYCPEGWYAYTVTNMCVKQCPSPFFADPTTERCVEVCPVSQLLFGEPFGRTCTPTCPQTTYSDFTTQQCVTQCPSKNTTLFAYDTFGFNDTNECLDQCPVPLYGWPVTYVCVNICPDPYYENITDHRCYQCPSQCASCNYPQMCLTCIEGRYLYSGQCVQSCPTFPVITYANPNKQCGTSFQCTAGYFALNITKSCVQTCPSGYFKNNLQQTCQSCQRGCITCTNSSNCIVCDSQTAIWYQFQCYTYCSILRKYYTENGCVSQCPDGTFLNLTTCQNCSSICKTCNVQPQNCVNCADGYYLSNNLCVQQCPTNSKAVLENSSLVCKSCSVVNCTTQPLTYTVTQFVDNFQYKFQLKFSEPVDIKGQIDKIIALKKISGRRLLQVTFQYLDYTIVDYGNGLYEFTLNNYDPSQGNNQFELQILDPASIQSLNGQLPDTTRKTIELDSTTSYSIKDYNPIFATINSIIIYLAMILLVFTFWADYNVWAPMFDYMQLMMAVFLINVILPPTPVYALGCFQYALFSFIPNLFTQSLPAAEYDPNVMNSNVYSIIQDFAFLRNMGQIYVILIALVIFLLISFGFSKKFFNKSVKSWCKKFIRQKFWKKYLFGIINILFLPVFMMGLLNLREYKVRNGVQGFSIFSSWLFMVSLLAVTSYFAFKIKRLISQHPNTYLMLQKAYNFITFQKIVLINNSIHHFIEDKNEIDLKKGREPRINGIRILPFDLQTRMGPMQISAPFINLLHKMMVGLFITACYDNPIVQIFFIILINIVYSIYLILKKPYIRVGWKELTTQIIIHNMVVVSLILLIVLVFKIQLNSLSLDAKNYIGLGICILILYGLVANLVYFIYRCYNYYFDNVWKNFVQTQIFKDNYTVEHFQLVKKYTEKDQLLIKQTRPRNQFLEAIKIQKGQSLAGMVLRDPNHTNSKQVIKQIKLRPNKSQIVNQDITKMFQTLHNEHEKSNKSGKSSQRLSKPEREKVRRQIFTNIEAIKEEEYEPVKLVNNKFQESIMNDEGENRLQNMFLGEENELQRSNEDDEYEFEYVEEEYPEDTPLQEIMKGCKKGDIVMP